MVAIRICGVRGPVGYFCLVQQAALGQVADTSHDNFDGRGYPLVVYGAMRQRLLVLVGCGFDVVCSNLACQDEYGDKTHAAFSTNFHGKLILFVQHDQGDC
jgi:hypothetical protein